MEFQRVNRSDPERIYMVAKAGLAHVVGRWYAWDNVTAQDGVSTAKPKGFNRNCIAGVAVQAVASGEYGLLQIWGFNTNCKGQGGDGSATSKLTAGSPCVFATSGHAIQRCSRLSAVPKADYGKTGICAVAIKPTNTAALNTQESTSGQFTMFIRCLG